MEPFFNEREFLGSGARGMPEPGGGRKEVDAVLSLERELVEQGDVVCSVSPKGEFVYVNEPFCRFFGKKRSQLIGKKSFPLAVPEDVPTVNQRLESLSSMNPVVGVMNRVLNVRNEVRWLQFVYRGIYGPRGRLIETRIVGRDITDRIAVEQALRESNERWKFAIESSGDGVWDWDLSTGRVKFSKRWKEMLGYSEDDIGEGVQDWQSRVHPDDLPAALAALKAHLERRKALYIQEFRMRKKDGRWKWILSRGKVIARDEKGRPLRVIGTHTDISAAKAAKKREAYNLKLVAEGAPCGSVLDAIVRSVEAEHADLMCVAMLMGEDGETLKVAAAPSLPDWFSQGLDGMKIGAQVSCAGSSAYYGQREVVEDIAADKRWRNCRKPAETAGVRSCWAEPILSRTGKVLGVLACYHQMARKPSRAEIVTVKNAVSLSAVAIEREQEEKALRDSERKFRAVFEQAAVGVAVLDTPTGRYLDVNQRMCEITGLSHREMLAKTFMDITHPEDLEEDLRLVRRLINGQIPSFAMEKRIIKPDGSICWISLTVSPLWHAGEPPLRNMAVVQDITARKEAEAKYRREVEYNRALISNTSVFMLALDPDGRIIHVNQAFLQGMGLKEKEVLQRSLWELRLLEKGEAAEPRMRVRDMLMAGDNQAREVRMRTKSGESRIIEVHSSWTRKMDGTPERLIITGTDVTERNRLEREVLNIVEREQARLGHDLHDGVGQTMTGIVSLIEGLESDLTGRHREDAARIRELIREAVAEIRRMSHGLSPTGVKYRGLVDALKMLAETVSLNHRTPCDCEIDASVKVSDSEVQAHLFRIAQEAVNNALKHGDPDNVSITLERVDGETCRLRVEDDGAGLPKAKKGAHAAKPGIGLRVMEYRAKLIGADLSVSPREEGGVEVACTFRSPEES